MGSRVGQVLQSIFVAMIMLGAVGAMSPRKSPMTGQVRVLYIGSPVEDRGVYAFLRADPFFEVQPVPAHYTMYKWDDLRRITRRYMPRDYDQLVEDYDVISLIGANPAIFRGQMQQWLSEAVVEGGLGNLIVGTDTWHFSDWIDYTSFKEVFPFEDPNPTDRRTWSELRILKPGSPLMSSLPFSSMNEALWLDLFTPVNAKLGSEVDAELVSPKGERSPFVVWWDIGNGRSLAHPTTAGTRWFGRTFHEWEFLPDWYSNIHLFSADMGIPPDAYIVHDIRFTLNTYHANKRSLISTIEFIDKFGTRTEPVSEVLCTADKQLKEVNSMYLNLELEASLALAKELVSELNIATELALRLRNRTLRWTHLIEWLVITGTSLVVGSIAWTTMIRRRLYKDMVTTRLSKNRVLT